MEIIDLRSDTVTKPTPEMRAAMADAPVGDDVYGEDPTVNRLQVMAAERMGKEAGLFVPSGTMGNLAALLAHCGRGDEIILGDKAHTFTSEAAGIAALGGVHSYQIANQADGTLNLDDITAAIRPDNPHQPVTRLIALENTHNRCGGTPLTAEYTQAVGDIARHHGLRLHLDGARIFNAAVALGLEAADLAAPADSVTFCLSKGLSAPVGSVLCGSADFIHRAQRMRKQLGGGMRQAGILAAAGIVALQTMVGRLEEDHRLARRLAEGLASIPDLALVYGMPKTNMVFLSLAEASRSDARQIGERLSADGVRVHVIGPCSFRLVTHYGIGDAAVEKTVLAFRDVMRPT
ncbi:MAG TPA: low-specificity L-threonine aldolase [Anaerolineales bacterium]|jgi:threonine aldolase|nr:low-specificity L-threonine aldolase [Anaerolineales bacterium]